MEGEGELVVEVRTDLGDGCWHVRVEGDLARGGEMPLPPYIHELLRHPDRYQTVYARRAVSAAAPTAGLHLTQELLERCRTNGIGVATVELAIGLDTFRPVTTKRLEDHPMHSEAYEVPKETMAACDAADRVVAVGTTVVRALESATATGELSGRTELFIRPGFEFRVVDVLLTNFHLPKTTLLAMIEAFVGPRWRDLYETALHEGYRFLSFGDAMLLERDAVVNGVPGERDAVVNGVPGERDAVVNGVPGERA
jgi:S-adenosylmethionine:tRNA ribosyltransferase-isomerase